MFLNPERPGMPDIDVDFSSHRRHEVIDYLIDKYGQDHVSAIGTYQTMTSKAILRDVGRVMNIDYNLILEWNKQIPAPNGNVMPIGEAVVEIPIIKEASEKYPQLFELAEDLQSMPKSKGQHASGFEVSPVNLLDNLPLWLGKDKDMVTQYEGGTLEDLGFIKLDILGVKVLSIIEVAVNLIKEKNNIDLNINELEFEDRATFKTIQEGNTFGVFQLASSGMTSIFTQLNHVDFDSLIAGIALYRPGPLQFLDTYIRRMNGDEKVTYLNSEMEEITKETKGVLLYQEQLMRIATELGGYTAGESDSFRKSVGRKDEQLMLKSLDELSSRMLDRGYSNEVTHSIIEQIKPFLGYGFNLSHSASYAVLAFYTAYLKTHYPLEFFIANMTIEDKVEEIALLINDARKNGLEVLPPDINLSQGGFSYASDTEIIYGLNSIKSLKNKAVEKILATRPYDSTEEFIFKTGGKGIDKTSLTALAFSGAFDNFEEFKESTRAEINFQLMLMHNHPVEDALALMEDFTTVDKLKLEQQYMGTYITGHPLDGLTRPIDWDQVIKDGTPISTLGFITKIKEIKTKKGDPMAFVGFSFLGYEIDGVCFPNLWEGKTINLGKNRPEIPYNRTLKEGMLLRVRGRFQNDQQLSFIVNSMDVPVTYNKDFNDHFETVEKKYGVTIKEPEPVQMPKFNIEDFQ